MGERQAETAQELMRARYSAYAVGDLDFVWKTWHPRTRPDALTPDAGLTWTGLEVIDTVDGRPGDESGEVEFRAHYRESRRSGTLHERSRFAVRASRWFYVDGELFR
ncbi:MAG: motif domain protein [Mycobacterium sp.]|jgi:SEC-C motif-containing protein|nr:motif domain protein [Mycobacterium sp.]